MTLNTKKKLDHYRITTKLHFMYLHNQNTKSGNLIIQKRQLHLCINYIGYGIVKRAKTVAR